MSGVGKDSQYHHTIVHCTDCDLTWDMDLDPAQCDDDRHTFLLDVVIYPHRFIPAGEDTHISEWGCIVCASPKDSALHRKPFSDPKPTKQANTRRTATMTTKSIQQYIDDLEDAIAEALGLGEDVGVELSFNIIRGEAVGDDEDASDDDDADEDDDAGDEDDDADDDGGELDMDPDENGLFSHDQFMNMDVPGVKAILTEYGIVTKTRTLETLVGMVEEAQAKYAEDSGFEDPAAAADDADDEDDPDEDEPDVDEDADDEDEDDADDGDDDGEGDYWTLKDLKPKPIGELRQIAKDYEIATKGLDKDALIAAILG